MRNPAAPPAATGAGSGRALNTGVFAERAWRELGHDPELLCLVDPAGQGDIGLPSSLPVGQLAWDSVAVASLALNLAGLTPHDRMPARIALDPHRIRTAYQSERHFRLEHEGADVWAPLSGFWQTRDGSVRIHANYPHHERRLRELLSVPADASAGTESNSRSRRSWWG